MTTIPNVLPRLTATTRMPDMWVRRRQQPRATLTRDYSRSRAGRRAARPPAGGLISWVTLALLTVGSVGSLGSAPALAVFGLASVFLASRCAFSPHKAP